MSPSIEAVINLKYNNFCGGFPSPLASAPAADLFFLHALTNSQLITLGGGCDSVPHPGEPSDLQPTWIWLVLVNTI